MDSLESWLDFRRGERIIPSVPKKCDECGGPCDGDITVEFQGETVGFMCVPCFETPGPVSLEACES